MSIEEGWCDLCDDCERVVVKLSPSQGLYISVCEYCAHNIVDELGGSNE